MLCHDVPYLQLHQLRKLVVQQTILTQALQKLVDLTVDGCHLLLHRCARQLNRAQG